jgi:hypothetical protein
MNNLKQTGLALASYTGDYGGYYPSWIGWGAAVEQFRKYCYYSSQWDGRWDCRKGVQGTEESTDRYDHYYLQALGPGMSFPIYFTGKEGTEPLKPQAGYWGAMWRLVGGGVGHVNRQTTGNLNNVPHGLGLLLTGGYLGEATTFYCPSATGMSTGLGVAYRQNPGAGNLSEWRTAGGFDANALLYGNWYPNAVYTGSSSTPRKTVVLSHYAYRNIPLGNTRGWHYGDHPSNRGGDGTDLRALAGTRPVIGAKMGQPFFRTDRELLGRALVSDAWDKGSNEDGLKRDPATYLPDVEPAISETRTIPGMGIAAHRSVYNVLYGDGHTAVFGDPQEKLVWHSQGWGHSSNPRGAVYFMGTHYGLLYYNHTWSGSSGGNIGNAGVFSANSRGVGGLFQHTAYSIWHEMDTAAAIDVVETE